MLLLALLIQVMLEALVVAQTLHLAQATKKPKRSHWAPFFYYNRKRACESSTAPFHFMSWDHLNCDRVNLFHVALGVVFLALHHFPLHQQS